MRDVALAIVFFILTLWTLRRPWVGLLVWSWFSYMSPHRFTYSFAYLFPWVAIIACVTMLVWLVSNEPKRFSWTTETSLEIVFCLWFTFTTFFAVSEYAWDFWDRAIKVQVMIFMTILIMRSRFRLNALIWTIVVSIGIFGVKGGIWALLTGASHQVLGPENTFISGNNEIGLALVTVLPLMRYLQLQANARWVRHCLTASLIFTTLAIFSTYSRGAFIALCAVGILFWLKSRHKVALAIGMVVVVVPLLRFMPVQWTERMQTIQNTKEEEMDSSAAGRLNAWRFAVNYAKDHPIIEEGFHVFLTEAFTQYAPDPSDRHDAHSIYFEVLAEQGIPGLMIFLALGLSTWITGRRVVRRAKAIPELHWMVDMVGMAQIGLCGFAVGGALAGLAYFDLPYHLMSIIIICKSLLEEHLRAAQWAADEGDVELSNEALVTT